MAKVTSYTTIDGDRWDLIAYRAYGNAKAMKDIIRANPHVQLTPYIPAGITLFIPIKERSVNTDKSLLPPWRR